MSQKMNIKIGTRASKLAMLQTWSVITRLHQQWPALDIQIEQIHTLGDRNTTMPLSAIGADGVFVMEIERALLEGRIDLAVHSLKDLPTAQPVGLRTCVVAGREDARDVLVWSEQYASFGNSVAESQGGACPRPGKTGYDAQTSLPLRIGTCSLRRTAQLRAWLPNKEILPLRGNV